MGVWKTWQIGEYEVSCMQGVEPWANCYVIRHTDSGEQIVVDPSRNAEEIAERVGEGGRLKNILLTHGHFDHAGAAGAICSMFRMKCEIHRLDARLLHLAPMYAKLFAKSEMDAPQPVLTFESNATFDIGGDKLRCVAVPGHSNGSVAFLLPGMAFCGDTILRSKLGRTDLPGGNATVLEGSVQRLLNACPGQTVFFAGHGEVWTVADAREWWTSRASVPAMRGER